MPTTKSRGFGEKSTKVTTSQVPFYPFDAKHHHHPTSQPSTSSSSTFPPKTFSSNTHHAHHPDQNRPSNFRHQHHYDVPPGVNVVETDFVSKCYANEFTCSSGECIPMTSICDQKPDCFDGSDEISCGKHLFALLLLTPSLTSLNSLLFVLSPFLSYLPTRSSKESSCTGINRFKCTSGECIAGMLRCNSIKDCSDGSDERDCGSKCEYWIYANHVPSLIRFTDTSLCHSLFSCRLYVQKQLVVLFNSAVYQAVNVYPKHLFVIPSMTVPTTRMKLTVV